MKRINKDIYFWIPRIFGILVILFISMFALDSFDGEASFLQKLLGFVIHLVPSYILILLLLVAWRWEFIGGVIITLLGLIIFPFHYLQMYKFNQAFFPTIWVSLATVGPMILWGLLFLLAHYKHKRGFEKIP